MGNFTRTEMHNRFARWTLAALAATSTSAVADDPPPFTPFSVVSASRPGPFIHTDGATLYRAACQSCHMPDARGAKGAGEYPSLASNARLESAAFATARVMNGWRGMPRFAEMLSDAQVAEVVNFVRTNFGNRYTDRTWAADVARMRAASPIAGAAK